MYTRCNAFPFHKRRYEVSPIGRGEGIGATWDENVGEGVGDGPRTERKRDFIRPLNGIQPQKLSASSRL